jgi:uncharacterized protein involved in exopolysaccharide biosynthesis
VELLKSTDLLRRVVVETGLDHDRSVRRERTPEKAIAAAVILMAKHLKVEAIRKTNMISVQYESRDPQMASRVLSALSVAYSEKHLEVHRPTGEFKFYDQQVNQYRQSLAALEQKIAQFLHQTGDVAPQAQRDQAMQRVSDFDATASQAQQGIREANDRIRVLHEQLATLPPQVIGSVRTSDSDQLISALKGNLSTLELKRTEMLGRFAPTYRPIQDLDSQIAVLKASIGKEMGNPLRDQTTVANPVYQWAQQELAHTQAEVSSLQARAASAAGIAAQYRGKAQGLNQESVQLEELLRDKKTLEESYFLYMHKREEARSSDALDRRGIVNVAIAQHPVVPSFPVRTAAYAALMTLLLCVLFGMAAAFVTDLLAPSFRTPDEIVRYLNIPALACLPKGEFS